MQGPKKLILENALQLVPFDGWSDYTLKEAAKRAGIPYSGVEKLFPRGSKDCAAFFLAEEDKLLAEIISSEEIEDLKIPQRIEKIILTRLRSWLPKREVIKRTMSFHSLP